MASIISVDSLNDIDISNNWHSVPLSEHENEFYIAHYVRDYSIREVIGFVVGITLVVSTLGLALLSEWVRELIYLDRESIFFQRNVEEIILESAVQEEELTVETDEEKEIILESTVQEEELTVETDKEEEIILESAVQEEELALDTTLYIENVHLWHDDMKNECATWMASFFENFDTHRFNTLTYKELIDNHALNISEPLREKLQKAQNSLPPIEYMKRSKTIIPEEWELIWRTFRFLVIRHPDYSTHAYEFVVGSQRRGWPGAERVRVPKGTEIKKVIHDENLYELHVIEESLILLDSYNHVHDITQLTKLDVMSKIETEQTLSSYPYKRQMKIAEQIVKMVCKTGFCSIGFNNLRIDRDSGKLIILDTTPYWGSMFLDSNGENVALKVNSGSKNGTQGQLVEQGLKNFVHYTQDIPIMHEVAKHYLASFSQFMSEMSPH